jgi:hypothetical protein
LAFSQVWKNGFFFHSFFELIVPPGIVFVLLTMFMEACRLDDPVQAVAVHLGGGVCASLDSALFSSPELLQRVYSLPQLPTEYDLFLGGGWKHLANTVVGVVSVCVFAGLITVAVLGSLYWIDHHFSLHWLFMRSSYETEQMTFMEERGLSALGIADVTKQNMEAETERDHIIMFAETPRAPRSAAESRNGRLKKVERARKRFERIRRKQIKKSRPPNAPATPPPLLHEQEQDEGITLRAEAPRAGFKSPTFALGREMLVVVAFVDSGCVLRRFASDGRIILQTLALRRFGLPKFFV